MSIAGVPTSFVRDRPVPPLPPPAQHRSVVRWLRTNLLSGPFNIALTLLCLVLIAWTVPPLLRFFFIDAIWSGSDRAACLASAAEPNPGACWPFVRTWLSYFVYGFYPLGERWRVDVFFIALALGVTWLLRLSAPRRGFGAIYFFLVLPILSYALLHGFTPIGLAVVPTTMWGGILVTVVVATVGMVFSLPLGILLALGRRSSLAVVRTAAVIFIEVVRGVPLITVLFMAGVMLPLFVPERLAPDQLVRALVGVALFASAYMAEVVRAGLLGVPRGQYDAARALGLSYWRMMGLVIVPQALRITLPNILNTFIGLFKDTTLVFVVAIFDFLRTIEVAREDPRWAAPNVTVTGYAFAALFYFICCYGMSRYAGRVETRLARGGRR
jgi:general L-amino acid transport system permease protein